MGQLIEVRGSVFPLGLSPAAVAGELDFFSAGRDFGESYMHWLETRRAEQMTHK
jgi:hypothetical protein